MLAPSLRGQPAVALQSSAAATHRLTIPQAAAVKRGLVPLFKRGVNTRIETQGISASPLRRVRPVACMAQEQEPAGDGATAAYRAGHSAVEEADTPPKPSDYQVVGNLRLVRMADMHMRMHMAARPGKGPACRGPG